MPKIHRMKEERGRERSERGEKGGNGKIETKNLYLAKTDGKEATWDLFFVNNV